MAKLLEEEVTEEEVTEEEVTEEEVTEEEVTEEEVTEEEVTEEEVTEEKDCIPILTVDPLGVDEPHPYWGVKKSEGIQFFILTWE